MSVIGRFAPSPTGPLHAGSLVTAVASYLNAKSQQGKWLLRIEDLDPPREVPGATDAIISVLDQFGFEWDDEILYQGKRTDIYMQTLAQLDKENYLYSCACSRADIHASGIQTPYGVRYSGTCRNGLPEGKTGRSIRLKTPDHDYSIDDLIQGYYAQNLQNDVGDFILRRADNYIAYHLATVVDDAIQHVTEIVRGSDLLESTPRQIYLQELLSFTPPQYTHIPVIVNASGEKLSKQTGAAPVNTEKACQSLHRSLQYLGQDPPRSLAHASIGEIWAWAIGNWNLNNVVKQTSITEQKV
ncbi:MAG TPA: tRNA glutamyl-Q(34) synthetase GluQRS [Gammaproteobacteria bacterium]|nr:tRNA glutamyl-Q(34) synthetase GluQRS [Gammaproteobacteria bacterium]